MRRFLAAVVVGFCVSCGGGSTPSPTAPSTSATATPTKVISVSGNLAFGNIQVGSNFSATMRISNTGNSTLTITGMTGSNGITSVTTVSWSAGRYPAGGSQDVVVKFSPTAPQGYSGTLTINGDQTSGTNTILISGNGSLDGLPVFSKSGTGNTVFDMPAYLAKLTSPENLRGQVLTS